MKKRILSMLLVCTTLLSLVGCSSNAAEGTEDNSTVTNTVTPEVENTEGIKTIPYDEEHVHEYVEEKIKEGSCTEERISKFVCKCGDFYEETVSASGHDYAGIPGSAKNATCTDNGKEEDMKCMHCEKLITGEVIPANGHSYDNYTYNNDATYEKDGTETATCSICGNKNTRTKAGTKLVKEEPECPYELGVWYDMDWQFFKICASKEEAMQEAHGLSTIYYDTLQSRYPNLLPPAASAGYTKWGYWVCSWRVPPQGTDVIPWTTE